MDPFGHGAEPPAWTKKSDQRGLGLQLAIAVTAGMSVILTFSVWRRRWPRLFAARTFRRRDLPVIPNSLFGWMTTLYKTTDSQVLEFAGLDAFVFLTFFRAACAIIVRMTILAFVFIGPLRWFYTGRYEDDPDSFTGLRKKRKQPETPLAPGFFDTFMWVYVVFTYVFTLLCLNLLRDFTNNVVQVRQEYLGRQNSITDRTLRLTGIPKRSRTDDALTEYMTNIRVQVRSVVLCYDWSLLDKLLRRRTRLIHKLEQYWAEFLGPTFVKDVDMERLQLPETEPEVNPATGGVLNVAELPNRKAVRPRGRVGFLGLVGPMVDLIDFHTEELRQLDDQIRRERLREDRKVASSAFITLDSVRSAQMATQTMLSPRPHRMLPHLAPAPHDVIWHNTYLRSYQRSIRTYSVTAVFIITTVFLGVPVSYLARFLDPKTIAKYAPWLSRLLEKSPWLETFVTQNLTTFIFTLFNVIVPYFYAYLSNKQGHISREDVELSTISKNFFYVLVNLFLVFTIAQNYVSLLRDTTQIAVQLAESLRRLSAFYTNLIVLQGFAILPSSLLQAGAMLQLPYFMAQAKSARDYHELYKPHRLNYGILLPTPLLILTITLMYSVLNTRILLFGCVYFWVGYYVYKYQFMYSMVHTQHSSGRLWTLILRRFWLGIGLFQLAMIGILVLEQAYVLAVLLLPLPFVLGAVWYDFEKFTEPLLRFIAVEAISTVGSGSPSAASSERANSADAASDTVFRDVFGPGGADVSDSTQGQWAASAAASAAAPLVVPGRGVNNTVRSHSGLSLSFIHDDSDEDTESEHANLLVHHLRHRHSRTLDEDREHNQQYVNTNTVAELEGPWIGIEGNECVIAGPAGLERRQLSFEDWE